MGKNFYAIIKNTIRWFFGEHFKIFTANWYN